MRIAAALLLALPLVAEQRLELVRHSLTDTHCRYREYVDGIPSDAFGTRPCSILVQTNAEAHIEPETPLRIIDGRVARREIVQQTPLERYAYDYDVESGALLRIVPLFFRAKTARVFDPNPVVALNDPTLQDRNDSALAVPESAYRFVELPDLVTAGPLMGPYVKIVDRQSPNIAPIDASADLVLDREAGGFEDVNVYFHIDRQQRRLQSLGYTGARAIAPYAVEVDAHSVNGGDNSFFLPSATRTGEGTLHYGEGGTDDAEDADLVVHEYGHAIQEWIAPSVFSGSFTSEARAMGEGYSDYLAYSAHAPQRIASGRDPFCFADWDARCWEDDSSQQCGYASGADCLRRLDGTRTMADYERAGDLGVEHRNGSIWSSALREIHIQLGSDVTDTIVLESMFGAPPQPTFAVMARRMIEADRLLFSGQHEATICASMLARSIVASCANTLPRGERTLFQSTEHAIAIPDAGAPGITSTLAIDDARAIEQIFVRVDITHPLRGDLRIELIAPDGTVVMLQNLSPDRDADVHATYGLSAQPVDSLDVLRGRSAAGVWKLVVRDLRGRDAGMLDSWGLLLQLEGDVPANERPRDAITQMVPVVTHVLGVGATRFASDVRIANPHDQRVAATLIFTRSGHDGRSDFGAIEVMLEPRQTIAFDDVVDNAFQTVGSGSLEVLGNVVVMSRTYADSESGTMGQQVPTRLDTTANTEPSLFVAPLPDSGSRYNLGIIETAGASGVVRAGDRELEILPFSHVQVPIAGELAEVRVASGDARVSAYISQIDNASGDAMFIPAEPRPFEVRSLIAPAISTSVWRSDLWIGLLTPPHIAVFPDTVEGLGTLGVLRLTLPPDAIGATRIRTDGVSQFVPLLTPVGAEEQHLLFIENHGPYRTNVGIVSEGESIAELTVFDAAGTALSTQTLATRDGIVQVPVTVAVTAGSAEVRFLSGAGRAYASLVDGRTGDATYIVYSSPRNDR